MIINHTKEFVENIQILMRHPPTEADRKQVSRCLIDYIGSTVAGGKLLENKTEVMLKQVGNGGCVRPVGVDSFVSLETAVLINGLHSHVAEMDDGVRFGMIHPGAPVISALLPVAELFEARSDALIRGILAGYEAAVRLANAMRPSHYQMGYHPTATCGGIGAAVGLAAMLDYTHTEMESALAAAAVSAAGSLKVVDPGSELKPFNVGRAAVLAVQAALVGKAGFMPPEDALAGNTGFLNMTAEEFDFQRIHESSVSGKWIHNVYVKPYAACRHAHPSIEAALDIRLVNSLKTPDIKQVQVTTYNGLKGRHDRKTVSSISSAKMSIPFSLAIALNSGNAGVSAFSEEAINNPVIQGLAGKIFIEEDQKFTQLLPQKRSAHLKIELYNGIIFERTIIDCKGEPENPLRDIELELKSEELAVFSGLEASVIRSINKSLWNLPDNLGPLFNALSTMRKPSNTDWKTS